MGILKESWSAVPQGEIYPKFFEKGTDLQGELLQRAQDLGLIETGAKRKSKAAADTSQDNEPVLGLDVQSPPEQSPSEGQA